MAVCQSVRHPGEPVRQVPARRCAPIAAIVALTFRVAPSTTSNDQNLCIALWG